METTIDRVSEVTRGNGAPVGTALAEEARPRRATAQRYQRIADGDRGTGGESLADFLGYFSIGLGLAELLAPQVMSRVIGVKHPDDTNRRTMRLMGLREISHGVAILSNQQPAKAVWSRVAGDALDLALLGRTMANPENDRGRTLFATANVLAVAALDVMCARQLSRQPETPANQAADDGIIRTRKSITIGRPVEEVYGFWHDFENLPRFMPAPGGRGTEVRVELEYDAPGGKLGSKVAMLWREEPGQQVRDDLRHLKQVLEIGEIVVSDATVKRGPHPAQPYAEPVHAGEED